MMIIDQSDFVARVRYQNKNVEFDDEQSDFWGKGKCIRGQREVIKPAGELISDHGAPTLTHIYSTKACVLYF